MKAYRAVVMFSLMTSLPGLAAPSSVALVYENETAVHQGRSTPGIVVSDGVLIPAHVVLSAGKSLLAAPLGEDLRHGVLVRLDNDLDLALIRLGEAVADAGLQAANRKKSAAIEGFLPVASSAAATGFHLPSGSTSPAGPFLIKINGHDVGTEPVLLKSTFRKSKFQLELVQLSTSTVWHIDVEIKSTPKLSFWKEGRALGLNDVPTPTFHYSHQAMFSPMKPGDTFKVPILVYFINAKEYDWTVHVSSKKQESMEQKVHVRFE